jgi:hypothetical protein
MEISTVIFADDDRGARSIQDFALVDADRLQRYRERSE